jgi:cytochrome c oxidase cbb3-type subunit I
VIRLLGGLMFLTGALIMVYNLILTVNSPITDREVVHPAPAIGLGPAVAVAGE